VDKSKFSELLSSTTFPNADFETFCSWSDTCYTRNCIFENEEFELILLCWEKGQITPIHGHGGEECWVKIIQGEFKETIYVLDDNDSLKEERMFVSKKGDLSYMIDFMGYHRLENLSEARSMSLHLYAKPIRKCQLFDEESETFVSKEMSYNTISNKMIHLK
jgi:cysteine dioxygenase